MIASTPPETLYRLNGFIKEKKLCLLIQQELKNNKKPKMLLNKNPTSPPSELLNIQMLLSA
jgi:hypothetical protein